MFSQIISHTPIWVWILLFTLIALGLSQAKDREVSLKRAMLLPLVMMGLSFNGMLQSFGSQASVLLIWTIALLAVAAATMKIKLHPSTSYQQEAGRLRITGSWVPLLLILGIFIGKYVLAIVSTMQPALTQNLNFSMSCAAIFGALSGVFLGRAGRLLKLVMKSDAYTPQTSAS